MPEGTYSLFRDSAIIVIIVCRKQLTNSSKHCCPSPSYTCCLNRREYYLSSDKIIIHEVPCTCFNFLIWFIKYQFTFVKHIWNIQSVYWQERCDGKIATVVLQCSNTISCSNNVLQQYVTVEWYMKRHSAFAKLQSCCLMLVKY